jgi:REP element-mobilizing transposase RayT
MSYVKNYLHCVWGTKNKLPFLSREIKQAILEHMKSNAKEKDIFLDSLNGNSEHIHCLLSLNPDQALSRVMQLIKGETSFWINRNKLTRFKFEWAVEYFAVSVSISHIPKVREYIRTQEEHHKRMTWEEEYEIFLKDYGFIMIQG